ncbi:MAG: GTP pyrophosphokinase [Parcubacteria group bacterium]|nr:GTP pyrophosphokinase [Parcubacteria group bacterium]
MRKRTLADAIALCVRLHGNQKDKAGDIYYLHPLRVMLNPLLKTKKERMTAALHDTWEDCGLTAELMRGLGYDEDVIEALEYLTKRPEEKGSDEGYFAFIERIRKGPILARKVKIADLEDNSDLSRFTNPTEEDITRRLKYHRARRILKDSLPA